MSKKKAKKRQERKPRLRRVQVTFASAGEGRLKIFADGSAVVVDSNARSLVPSRVDVASVYKRDNGKADKVLTRAPGVPTAIHFDTNRALATFPVIFAVDTNTKMIRGESVSVCASIRLEDVTVKNSQWQARFSEAAVLEFVGPTESPEHIGWNFAVRNIEQRALPGPIALIVDSDMDSHLPINTRELPYFADQLLPQPFTLVYASSDAGTTEFIANKAIAMCDDIATQVLQQIEDQGGAAPPYQTDLTAPVSGFRTWIVSATPM